MSKGQDDIKAMEGKSVASDIKSAPTVQRMLYTRGLVQNWQRPEFICGWGAAFVNICVTFPINKVMFRQQLHGVRTWSAVYQLRKEGLTHIYRGLLPPLLQKTTSNSLMFGLYYEFHRQFHHHFPDMYEPCTKSVAALMAGTCEAALTPFERIQVLMQDRTYHKHYNNTMHAFKEVYQRYGFMEFYRGQSAILLRNGPSNIFFFVGRDYLLKMYSSTESPGQKVLLDFVSGALLGAMISTLWYPLNVVKVRMQSQVGGEFMHILPTLRLIKKERNTVRKMFRGVHINFTRALISWGIVNATFEYLMWNWFRKSTEVD